MTILTSVVNIAYQVSGFLSALLIKWFSIECVEDPDDADNVLCNFDNLWILIVVVNLTTLIPLVFIRKVPDEEQLKIIGEELKSTTLDRDERRIRKNTHREELIGLFWFFDSKVFPFCKKNVCRSCGEEENTDELTKELEMEQRVMVGDETPMSPESGTSMTYPDTKDTKDTKEI